MSSWFPLHTHSHFSLLDGLSKPEQIAERIVECGHGGCALTDHGTIAGVPSFLSALKDACKCGHQKGQHDALGECNRCDCTKYDAAGLKAIAGCEFYLCRDDSTIKTKENFSLSHLCVLAKGKKGWHNLIRASSESNQPHNFYRKPRLNLEKLGSYAAGEWIAFSGHMGSDLANVCFVEPRLAYSASSYEEARELVAEDWRERVFAEVARYQAAFGKENFYLEIQLMDQENLPAATVVANILRWAGKKLGVPCVATADSHYARKEDAADQRILLCAAMDTTLKEVQRKLNANEDVGLGAFFQSSKYHIPTAEEMAEAHTPEELACSLEIASRCEAFSVSGPPLLPVFDCPGGLSPDNYFRKLCEGGWKRKIEKRVPEERHEEYQAELERQLEVLTGANLSSYFLITQDFIRYAIDTLKCRVGEGRGSGAGCMPSYLTDITNVDPIKHELLFERFYNAGRNTPDRVALPDIDSDFPIRYRDRIIEYIRDKYGKDRVCQMATFSRMQGRGALKDVLRAHERCSFEEMNRVTEHIPDEAAIADELQEMAEAGEEPSIIRWALENTPEPLREWCFINADGKLEGPLDLDFAQAIRLEGTKRSQGKHASGVIISSVPLADVVPMIYDKSSGQQIVGVDYRDAEAMGLVKFDILGTAVLDKIMDAESIIRTGAMSHC